MIGRLAEFWSLVREIDLRHVRSDLERRPRIVFRGQEGSGRRTLARSLVGPTLGPSAEVLPEEPADLGDVDLTILVVDGRQESRMETRHAAIELGLRGPLLVVFTHADVVIDPARREELQVATTTAAGARGVWVDARDETAVLADVGPAVLDLAPGIALGLGRRVPELRGLIAGSLIREASRVNAEFALMTNLPAIIPIGGGVVGNLTDIVVLTKNQAILVFKLAGLYGRDVGKLRAMAMEILPVVGSAFLWRTLARSAVGMFPPAVAAIPKTAIAYAGTFLVGETARYYYEHGVPPPDEAIQRFGAEGLRLSGEVAARISQTAKRVTRGRSAS